LRQRPQHGEKAASLDRRKLLEDYLLAIRNLLSCEAR
jgi:hypothetical protein